MPTSGRSPRGRPRGEVVDGRVVCDVLVALGHHRTPPVPAAPADDVHRGGAEGVGVAHDRADVQVVAPVLDGHVERVPAGVEVGDDGVDPPVAVAVDDVAPVALRQQIGVEPGIVGPGLGVGPDADGRGVPIRPAGTPGRVGRVGRRVSQSVEPPPGGAGGALGRRARRACRGGRLGGRRRPVPRPSCERIWARRAWASLFIDACSTSSMRLSTDDSVSSAMPLALA